MLKNLVNTNADRYPNKIAISIMNKHYTWLKLASLTDLVTNALLKSGIKPGDRVAFFLYNSLELVISYFACLKIGAIILPINYRLKEQEVLFILQDAQPKTLISQNELFQKIKAIVPLTQIIDCYLTDWQEGLFPNTQAFDILLKKENNLVSLPIISGETAATLLYTSGTLGKPKGVIHQQKQLQACIENQHILVNHSAKDCTLLFLPMCHTFGFFRQLLPCVAAGTHIILMPRFDAATALQIIKQEAVSLLYGVPTMYVQLINQANKISMLPNNLRVCIVSGDAAPLALHQQFKQNFGLELTESMAQTETMMYAANPPCGRKKPGSIGLPVSGMRFKIIDDQCHELPRGETGEIAVAGPTLMQGYYKDTSLTAQTLVNGWCFTGDLGCIDEEGYLWFKGRKKQIIVHNGFNVSPQEVENAFYQHPAVLEAAVIGIADEKHGEIIKAFVALKTLVSTDELLKFVRNLLADYKVPKEITFLDELPKGNTGKIDRNLLKKNIEWQSGS